MRKRHFMCKPSSSARRSVKAATVNDMLVAFEDRLQDFRVSSKTGVSCSADSDKEAERKSREIEIYDNDYTEKYRDVEAGFGEPDAVYTLAEIKEFWNKENMSDPILADYDSYESWWSDTLNNFLVSENEEY